MAELNASEKKSTQWFESWFNSPYYHILYKDRDEDEAGQFLDQLLNYLQPPPSARILDVACGKGRHSLYLSKKGFDVTGFDLSEESIRYNKRFENVRLSFYVHDMRNIFRTNYFDIVMNLFSSFGYFENEHENIRCLQANAMALKPGGKFIFDYFNPEKVRLSGNVTMEKTVDKIRFHIRKFIEKKCIHKEIRFSDGGKDYTFDEHVLLPSTGDLEKYFSLAGLEIIERFGNYKLDPFSGPDSERIILVARKS